MRRQHVSPDLNRWWTPNIRVCLLPSSWLPRVVFDIVSTVGATMLWPEHGLRAERGLTENGNLTAGRPGNLRSRTDEVAFASVLKKLTV